MDDLNKALSDIMSTEEGRQNLQNVAAMLGLGGNNASGQQQQNAPDMSALSGLMSSLGGSGGAQQNKTPDLSALSGLMSSLGGSGGAQQNKTPDLSALSGLMSSLGGGNTQQQSGGDGGLNIDPAMLMKITQVMSSMNSSAGDDNIHLLRALKPHIKKESKIDEAIRILQLLNMIPSLKEIGLFGGDLF